MSWPQPEQPQRSKRDRIERLRRRLVKASAEQLRDIIKGVLDLLEDEL